MEPPGFAIRDIWYRMVLKDHRDIGFASPRKPALYCLAVIRIQVFHQLAVKFLKILRYQNFFL